jgi:putative ABC transport system permease protein
MIRRTLLFACAALLTVGLGIGCTTAIFSLLNEPQSSPPDSFFRILKGDRGEGAVATFPQYMGFRDLARSPRELAAWSAIPLNAPLGSDDASKLRGTLVSCNFFKVFGAETPLAGGLLRAEDCYSAHTVAVISERLWRDRFSAHPDIGGREPCIRRSSDNYYRCRARIFHGTETEGCFRRLVSVYAATLP